MPIGDVLDEATENLATEIVDAIFTVHKTLGPGLLERVYEECLYLELTARGLFVERQLPVSITYRGHVIENAFRLDLLVEKKIVIELKAVEVMNPIYRFQTKTHVLLSHKTLGFLTNFNVALIRDGIQRIIA